MNSATIAFRVAPETKRRADELFSRLGMSISTGMSILLMQTLEHRGFPFPIVLRDKKEESPNAETRAVLERVQSGTEPLYGPFDSTVAMLDAAAAMED